MVENVKEEHGFNRALEMLNFSKGTWDYHENEKVIKEEKYAHLKEPLHEIVEEHPEYGGRKIKAELTSEYGHTHGRELIYELMRMWGLKRSKRPEKQRKAATGRPFKRPEMMPIWSVTWRTSDCLRWPTRILLY
jgi:hypothetical protein